MRAGDKTKKEKKEKVVLRVDYLDSDRYERSKRIKWFDIDKVHSANILVVGAGALGNEVIKNLVLSGYKNITLVDMDYVVASNLNRCVFFTEKDAEKKRLKSEVIAERVKELDPTVDIKAEVKKIEEYPSEFFNQFDAVLGCLDNIAARLHINSHAYYYGVPYVDGGTLGLLGKVQVIYPPDTPCLECTMNKTHMRVLEKRFSCTGRDVTFFDPKLAAEITTTSIIAAVQVREILKITHGMKDNIIKNLFYYDAMRNMHEILELEINPNCPHHGGEISGEKGK